MYRSILAGAVCLVAACSSTAGAKLVPWPTPDQSADVTTPTGLKYSILDHAATGAATAQTGQTVHVNYAGWLTNGVLFDSSFAHGSDFSFKLGAGNVIKGWDQGVAGMQVGERRKLVVPSSLGYGEAGAQGIPGNSTLIFDVQLLSIQ